uniref:Uncharacterized protein n=1 Tax=Anguilla anguilla TaxID=7936 RepID=A0A0E9Q4G4_ANGAN
MGPQSASSGLVLNLGHL